MPTVRGAIAQEEDVRAFSGMHSSQSLHRQLSFFLVELLQLHHDDRAGQALLRVLAVHHLCRQHHVRVGAAGLAFRLRCA